MSRVPWPVRRNKARTGNSPRLLHSARMRRGSLKMERINIRTSNRDELIDITEQVQRIVSKSKIKEGLCFVFVPHTTAGITINENADPSVRKDILYELNKIIPHQDNYAHLEGNAAAHIKASILGSSVRVFIENGKLQLGTWQGIYFAEFDGPRSREIWVNISEDIAYGAQRAT